ncbi:MAG: glycosyltransferase [Candidatus Aminicenantales bacterium]
MRILVVADGYPPVEREASDLGCRDIVEALEGRGHEVQVLTTGSGPRSSREDGGVLRRLSRGPLVIHGWQDIFRKEVANQGALRDSFRDFHPKVALFFNFSKTSASLPLLAEDLGCPACLHVSGDGPAVWERDGWFREQPQGPGGYRAFRFMSRRFNLAAFPRPLHTLPAIFTDRYFREATERVGKTSPRATVIPWGIDLHRFARKEPAPARAGRLLYFGPIGPEHGIETAIETLGLLKQDGKYGDVTLTIAGSLSGSPAYVASLHDRAAALGVGRDLSFLDYSPDRSSPELFLRYDVFVYPVARVEPLALSLLEAMACGLAVVASSNGGNADALENKINALVIPPENPELCAGSLRQILDNPELAATLGTRARRTIEEKFGLDFVAGEIEQFLMDVVGRFASGRSVPYLVEHAAPASAAQMERWFRTSRFLVRAKLFLKPNVLLSKLKPRIKNVAGRFWLAVYPPIFNRIHRRARRGDPAEKPAEPREILVVQPADLGDLILSGPFLRDLRALFPKSKIALAVHPGMANVVEKCPHVDEIIIYPWRSFDGWKDGFAGDVRWWRRGRIMAHRIFSKHRFDLAVSLRWNDDAAQAAALILMAASGAERRVAYVNSANGVNRLITEGPGRGAPTHEIEYQADLLRYLGGRPGTPTLEAWTSPEDDQAARNLMDKHEIKPDELLIAMAPGAAWEFRRWPVERFIELGRWLQETYGARILILAGKAEEALSGQIEKGLIAGKIVNLAGQTTIREMASLLKFCRFFIGNDSGPMHVAVAAGVTAVGLFGPGDYARFRPWGPDHAVVHLGLTCNPCSENCLFGEARCIRGISVEQIKDVFKRKLASQRFS